MIEEDVLPFSKVKTVFPSTNGFLACILFHTRAAFPWYFASAVQQGAIGLKGAKLCDVTLGFYAAAIQDWCDKQMGRNPLLNPFFMQMYPQQNCTVALSSEQFLQQMCSKKRAAFGF